jgi:hypothetical protein
VDERNDYTGYVKDLMSYHGFLIDLKQSTVHIFCTVHLHFSFNEGGRGGWVKGSSAS